MWSYGLDLRSIRLTVVKVVVSSGGTYNKFSYIFFSGGSMTNAKVLSGFCDDKRLKSTVLHSTRVFISK